MLKSHMRRPNPAAVWHVCGTTSACGPVLVVIPAGHGGCDLGFLVGAGEGNRTLMTSLEGWGSAIELRPRAPVELRAPHQVSTDSVPVRRHRRRSQMPGRAGSSSGRCGPGGAAAPRMLAHGTVGYVRFHGMWRSLVSAPALGAGGRRFESGHPDQVRVPFDLHLAQRGSQSGSHVLPCRTWPIARGAVTARTRSTSTTPPIAGTGNITVAAQDGG